MKFSAPTLLSLVLALSTGPSLALPQEPISSSSTSSSVGAEMTQRPSNDTLQDQVPSKNAADGPCMPSTGDSRNESAWGSVQQDKESKEQVAAAVAAVDAAADAEAHAVGLRPRDAYYGVVLQCTVTYKFILSSVYMHVNETTPERAGGMVKTLQAYLGAVTGWTAKPDSAGTGVEAWFDVAVQASDSRLQAAVDDLGIGGGKDHECDGVVQAFVT